MRGRLVALGFLFAGALTCDGIREDELLCEEALAQVSRCCPEFSARGFKCEYIESCIDTIHPDIPIDRARCLIRSDCDQIRAERACEEMGSHPYNAAMAAPDHFVNACQVEGVQE